MLFEKIKTERLLLKKFTPAVYNYIFQNLTDEELIIFLSLKSMDDLIIEKEKFKKGLTTFKTSFVNFKLFDPQSNAHIGNCGFHTWYVDHFRAEIGYDLISDDFKGKGLMTEALKTIIPIGFNEMNLNRIEAYVGPTNIPSLKLLSKFGFIQEGLLREHYKKGEVIEDSLVFSLLKKDWE